MAEVVVCSCPCCCCCCFCYQVQRQSGCGHLETGHDAFKRYLPSGQDFRYGSSYHLPTCFTVRLLKPSISLLQFSTENNYGSVHSGANLRGPSSCLSAESPPQIRAKQKRAAKLGLHDANTVNGAGGLPPSSISPAAFSSAQRDQTLEMLLSRERVLSLLYAKVLTLRLRCGTRFASRLSRIFSWLLTIHVRLMLRRVRVHQTRYVCVQREDMRCGLSDPPLFNYFGYKFSVVS